MMDVRGHVSETTKLSCTHFLALSHLQPAGAGGTVTQVSVHLTMDGTSQHYSDVWVGLARRLLAPSLGVQTH